MNKQFLIVAFIIISCIESYSQIRFENGYFINDSNNRTECLIKNIDWKNNPTQFEYKLSQDDAIQKASISTIKEFGINNVSKYIRVKTKIDRSSDQIVLMSSHRNPDFKEELLFLKVLIEGEASLYIYNDGNLIRFFYKIDDSEINQLVYKKYQDNYKIAENIYFKQQLFLQLKCSAIEKNDIERLRYKKNDLEKIFIKYNECYNSSYTSYEPKKKQDLLNITLRPGVNWNNLDITNTMNDSKYIGFDNYIGVRFGVEIEFILPFNKNKWGIIVEPTFQHYNSKQSREDRGVSGGIIVPKVDYKSIEFPFGVRHYFYLNDRSKLFANISYVFNLSKNSTVKFLRKNGSVLYEFYIKPRRNLALGVGYKYKDRYSIEIRYNTDRDILRDYIYWKSKQTSFNIIFGVTIF